MSELWDELEYRALFEAFPPRGNRPSGEGLTTLERRLNHSRGGIIAQWEDGNAYCTGAPTVASDALQSWLDRTGTCR